MMKSLRWKSDAVRTIHSHQLSFENLQAKYKRQLHNCIWFSWMLIFRISQPSKIACNLDLIVSASIGFLRFPQLHQIFMILRSSNFNPSIDWSKLSVAHSQRIDTLDEFEILTTLKGFGIHSVMAAPFENSNFQDGGDYLMIAACPFRAEQCSRSLRFCNDSCMPLSNTAMFKKFEVL